MLRVATWGTPMPTRDDNTLLSKRELAAALSVSLRTLERMMAAGDAPQAIRMPSGRRKWRWGDVRQWMDEHRERPAGG
jgi:predicted DNA-binding transcriptional regulator AlpA